MKRLLKIIGKNLKLLSRSKSSMVIFVLGPLLVIFLAGFAFNNTDIYRVNVGAYSKASTGLTKDVLDSLRENNLNVKKFLSAEECIDDVKQGGVSVCMVFKGDLKIGKDMDNELEMYVDYSKINLAYLVIEMVSSGLSETSSNLTMSMTSNVLERMFATQEEINKDKEVIKGLVSTQRGEKEIIDGISTRLKKLDLSIDLGSFKTGDIRGISNDLQKKADVLTKDVLEGLGSVEAKVRRMNASEDEKDGILQSINRTKARAELISGQIGGKDSEIDATLSEIEAGLQEVQGKLSKAAEAREAVKDDINELIVKFAEDIKTLAGIQQSFDRVNAKIAGIEVTDAGDIAEPIVTTLKPISVNTTHLYNIFPSLILVVVMFVSILLSSTLIMMEKGSRAYVRNFITPTREITFVLATYFTSLIVLSLQIGIILLISFFVFKFLVATGFLTAMLTLFLSGTVFILLGMLIGYLFHSEEATTLTSIFVGSVFIFLSNLILPMESMPDSVLRLGVLNPFVVSETMLRKAIFFGFSLHQLLDPFVLLLTYSVILFGLTMMLQKRNRDSFLSRKHKLPQQKKG